MATGPDDVVVAEAPIERLLKAALFRGDEELVGKVAAANAAIAAARESLEAEQAKHPHGSEAWWAGCDAITRHDAKTALIQERMLRFYRPPYELYGIGAIGVGFLVGPRLPRWSRGRPFTQPRSTDRGGVCAIFAAYVISAAAHERKQRDALVAVGDVLDSLKEDA